MTGIDQRREAGRFAGKTGEYDTAPILVHQRGEKLARIARGTAAFEYHLVAIGLETFDPANEWRRPVKKRRVVEQADKRNRQAQLSGMIEHPPAIGQCRIDVGNG